MQKYSKFIYVLLTNIRKISLYPARHPAVSAAIKNVHAGLSDIFAVKNAFSLSISMDNRILVEGETISAGSQSLTNAFVSYLKKLDIENLTFNPGISEQEVEHFIRILLLDPKEINTSGGMNKVFQDRNIEHIRADLFSYIKVKKGEEVVTTKRDALSLEALKSKIKEYSEGKVARPADINDLENKIFALIGDELKAGKKITSGLRDSYKKFIRHCQDKEGSFLRLKSNLLEAGLPEHEIAVVISRMGQEFSVESAKPVRVRKEDFEKLETQNEQLRSEIAKMQQGIETREAELRQLKSQAKKISDEKERVDNIIRNMGDGLVVVDPQGNILMVNPIAEALLGISMKDVGKPLKEIIKDEHLLTAVKDLAAEKEGTVEKDIELFSPGQSTKKILRTSSAVVEDHNGRTLGMVTILNDITKQKELEQLKSNFVMNVSHELRTPLVAMEKSVSLMLDKSAGPVTDTQEQFLSIAKRNLKRLTLMINDLLELSKLESGKTDLIREPYSIEKVIDESADSLGNWAKTKSIEIQKKVPAGIPQIHIDPNRVIQVLNNLIGNSIKFTPQNGKIMIEASLNNEKQEVEVSVTDTGVGIPKEALAKVFSKFYQVEQRNSSDILGTGIGLCVSKEIVELHGGRIWVESEYGHGAKFAFSLPLKQPQTQSPSS